MFVQDGSQYVIVLICQVNLICTWVNYKLRVEDVILRVINVRNTEMLAGKTKTVLAFSYLVYIPSATYVLAGNML